MNIRRPVPRASRMIFLRVLTAWLLAAAASAAVPPADKLLPTNTLAVVTTPGFAAARAAWTNLAWARLWADPAMAEFRAHADSRLATNVAEPLAALLGADPRELAGLVTGQLTVAVLAGAEGPVPLLLADTGEGATNLAARLDAARGHWLADGRSVTTNAAGSNITWSVAFPRAALAGIQAFLRGEAAGDEPPADAPTVRLTVAQAGGLLVAGGEAAAVEDVLARLAGSSGGCLADEPAWQADVAAAPAGETWRGWASGPRLLECLVPGAGAAAAEARRSARPSPARIVSALGLDGVRSFGFGLELAESGPRARWSIRIPPDARRGLFRVLAIEARDAAVPEIVPADVLRFTRWRLNGTRAWEALEQTLTAISPEVAGVFQLFFSALVDEEDPQADFRRRFVRNLGDDFLSWRVPAGSNAPAASLTLLGSTNAPQLARALGIAARLLPDTEDGPPVRIREADGRRTWTVSFPALLGGDGEEPATLHFAAGTNHVVLSGSAERLRQFFGTNAPAPSLAAALPAAALARIGGPGGGVFSYENVRESARQFFAAARAGEGGAAPGALQLLLAARLAGRDVPDPAQWFDLRLLPDFAAVERHFGVQLSAGGVTSNGWELRTVQPAP